MSYTDYFDKLKKDKAERHRRKAEADWVRTQQYIRSMNRPAPAKRAPDMKAWLRS